MRREDITDELKDLAFDFLYWFSRFEFSLKENKFLKNDKIGANAEPAWDDFVVQYAADFKHTPQTQELLRLNPMRQKVGANSCLEWKDVVLDDCLSDLCKIVRLLKTIRNNLFHGGKHGAEGWDDVNRTMQLLSCGKSILDQLIGMTNFQADYARYY